MLCDIPSPRKRPRYSGWFQCGAADPIGVVHRDSPVLAGVSPGGTNPTTVHQE